MQLLACKHTHEGESITKEMSIQAGAPKAKQTQKGLIEKPSGI